MTIDTLRSDHLGCYGYAKSTSPTIDRFCEQAIRFQTAITPTPTTDPAHSSIMTGLYPANHGVLLNGWRLADEHETLAELLRASGYQTMAAVSVAHLSQANGFGQGFLKFYSPPDGRHHVAPPEVASRAIEMIQRAREPFFLWVHFWDPHGDYAPPERHDLFAPTSYAGELSRFGTVRQAEGRIAHIPPEDLDRIVSLYDGEIHFTDSQLNSDHGEYLFDGNLRVPLLMRFPAGEHGGTVVDQQVSNMDILPTVVEYLGLRAPARVDGVSLLGAVQGESLLRSTIFLQKRVDAGTDLARYHDYGARTMDWKYIIDQDTRERMLFDLNADALETTNLIDEYPEQAANLRRQLRRWHSSLVEVPSQTISDEQARSLKALGYVR